MVINTAQLHSIKPERRFCAGSNPALGVSEIRDGGNKAGNKAKRLSSINHTNQPYHKTIHHYSSLSSPSFS